MTVTPSPIYLDHHAHTPIDPRVHAELCSAYLEFDFNSGSSSPNGELSRQAGELARLRVAKLLNVSPAELIFTSGATEANNLAVRGLVPFFERSGRTKIVIAASEHLSVLNASAGLPALFEVLLCPVRSDGQIDLVCLKKLVTKDTGLVSVAAANHEVGTIQPLSMVIEIAKEVGALVHSDITQAVGKIPLSLDGVDLASLSSHKLYGPVGIGAIMVRRQIQRVLDPLIRGGDQERGLRAGTLPVPLAVAFGRACEIAMQSMVAERVRVGQLRDRLLERLSNASPLRVNGRNDTRLDGNLNLSFDNVDAEALTMKLKESVSISTGSACSSKSLEPSHVLLALGLSRAEAESSIRIGLGRFTTIEEVDAASAIIVDAVHELRGIRKGLSACN